MLAHTCEDPSDKTNRPGPPPPALDAALGRWGELKAALAALDRRRAPDALEIAASELMELSLAAGRGLPASAIIARLTAWRRRDPGSSARS
jgi:hypothetical protein